MDSTTPDNESASAGSHLDRPPTTVKPAITNFPLPAELREEIYGYLLDGERTKTFKGADHSDPYAQYQPKRPAYPFSTSLLAVNKTIGSEAAAFFHRQDSFTLVSFSMSGFHLMSRLVDLPIVASAAPGAAPQCSKRMSLMVGLQWPHAPHLKVLTTLKHPDHDYGSIIIRLADLPRLILRLRFLCTQTLPPTLLIGSTRGTGMELHATPRYPKLHMHVRHLSTELKKPSAKERALVVQCLNTLRAGGAHPLVVLSAKDSFAIQLCPVIEQSLIWPLQFAMELFVWVEN